MLTEHLKQALWGLFLFWFAWLKPEILIKTWFLRHEYFLQSECQQNLSFISFKGIYGLCLCLCPPPDILCVHFSPVIPWLQWLWWWPYSTMTIRCVVFDIPHPRWFCFDKTQRWHEIPDFHRWTTDFKYLTLCMCPGITWFSGGKERRSAVTNRV